MSGLAVFVLAGIAYAFWVGALPSSPKDGSGNEQEEVVCTADAYKCPDGTYVGRTGPKCEFVCPNGTPTSQKEILLQAKLAQQVSGLDVQIIPLEVIEDSRCPTDVQCIQAGTVKVKAQLVSGLGTATEVFTLNQSITTEAEVITLIDVIPEKISTTSISQAHYRFTFRVTKR